MARDAAFTRPLLQSDAGPWRLLNRRTGRVLASTLLPALSSESRRTGLLKHDSLADGEAMVIAPTSAVHTWFMRFDIDIVFVKRDGRVVKTRGAVKPWRMTGAFGGYAVIEMKGGALREGDALPGDVLEIVPA